MKAMLIKTTVIILCALTPAIHADENKAQSHNSLSKAIDMINSSKGKPKYQVAINIFIKHAEKNNAEANYYLGKLYYKGLGVKKDIDATIRYLNKSISLNEPRAYFLLGNVYESKKDMLKAIDNYKSGAEKNNLNSVIRLSEIHSHRKSKFYNKKDEVKYLKQASELGHADSSCLYAYEILQVSDNDTEIAKSIQLIKDGADKKLLSCTKKYISLIHEEFIDFDEVIWHKYVKQAAALGDASSMKSLGDMYKNGIGTKRSITTALTWYEMAAKHGNINSQMLLAEVYATNDVVKKDINKSVYWYGFASNNGNLKATIKLAEHYEHKENASPSLKKAIDYYEKAHKQGYKEAYYRIALIYESKYKNDDLAFEYFLKAAKSGHINANRITAIYLLKKPGFSKNDVLTAIKHLEFSAKSFPSDVISQYILGDIYSSNDYGIKNPELSRKWLEKSAAKGYLAAQTMLFEQLILLNDKKYHKFARYWIDRAAKQGSPYALNNLGVMYALGQGGKQDYIIAFDYYKKALDKGNDIAAKNIGEAYEKGWGVKKDLEKSKYYYDLYKQLSNEK